MSNKKTIFVQHRREYYNDFDDCLRDYQKTKSKATKKFHHSDGDNGESDSEYVDCTDATTTCDLRLQSTLSSKSLPHVSTALNYHDHEIGNRNVLSSIVTAKQQQQQQQQTPLSGNVNIELGIDNIKQIKKNANSKTAQELVVHDNNSSKDITTATQSHNIKNNNNNDKSNNQIINKKIVDTKKPDKGGSKTFINEKSITIDTSSSTATLPKLYVNDLKKAVTISSDSSDIVPKEKREEKKRKSCKKRQNSVKDNSQK